MKWETLKLEDLCSVAKGKKHNEVLPSQNTFQYIQIEDLHGGCQLKFTDEVGTHAENTDVLIAWDGANAGTVGVGFDGMIGSTLARLRPKVDGIESRFLYWFLESKFDLIKSQRTGATIPHVNGSMLRQMNVPLPPLPIQKQIADTLDKADALRQKDQQLLQKYDDLAQSIFYEMFGDPNSNQQKWAIKPIVDVTSFIDYRGKTPERTEGIGVPLITAKNVKFGYFDYTEKDYITAELYDQIMTRGFPQPNDVLFTTEGATLGNVCRIPPIKKFAVGQRLISLKGKGVTPEYLQYIMCSDFFQDQVFKRATGSAAKGIRSAELKKLVLPVPDYGLQEVFSKSIAVLEKQQQILQTSKEHSDQMFQGLIDNYFS